MTNRYQVTWKNYRSWAVEKFFTKRIRLGLILAIILLPSWLYIIYIIKGNLKLLIALFSIFCIASNLYHFFIQPLNREKAQYQRKLQIYGAAGWIREIIFGEEIVLKEGGKDVMSFSYKNIDKIEEKGNQVKIIFNDNTLLRLYKDAFVDSDWDACREKLYQEKYGR